MGIQQLNVAGANEDFFIYLLLAVFNLSSLSRHTWLMAAKSNHAALAGSIGVQLHLLIETNKILQSSVPIRQTNQ